MLPINFNISYIIYSLIIITIVSILLLMLFRFSLYKWFMWTGIANIIVGITLITINIAIPTILETVKQLQNDIDPMILSLTNNLLGPIKSNLLLSGLILLTIGIVLIILYILINRKLKIKQQLLISQL